MNNIFAPEQKESLEFFHTCLQGQRHESGYNSLIHLTLETAVEDVKTLIKEGIIVNGKCVMKWPQVNGKPKLIIHDYFRVEQVIELLDFMNNGDLDTMLKIACNKLDAEKINKQLGI
jgi:hypothetical protein